MIALASLVVLLAWTGELRAQTPSLANYTITRQTGITYNSISSTGNSVPSWRNSYQWIYDDNRSYPIPIGFDFWYDGIKYTTLSVSTNGFVDFSSSAADGSIGANQTGRDYDSENFTVSSTVPYPGSRASWNVLAPIYYDLTTQNETNPLGTSFKYLTSGVAPNRIFTVEFDSLSAWNQAGLGTALNFQVKLYETTGKIEFVYGNMIPGTASYAYTCAINGPDLSGGLTAANFQTQQSVNSATFGTTPVNNLTPPPASLSQLRFLPPTPLDPTSLTFTGVTTTAMTLNWTDNATNEVGYAIYQSSDGSNYAFITQLAAHAGTGAMNYTSTGLVPNTTYYWRIYAVTEGGVSNVLAGNQSTAGAPNDTSATSGLWSNSTTWKSGGVPTSITNVVIADGHTVTIDKNFTVNSLTIGTGVSGILRFGNDNTPRYDTVITGVTVNSGGTLDVSTSSNTNGHLLVVGGDLINNSTLNLATDADSKVRLEFNKNGSQVINGSGSLTKVYRMTLNMGSSSNNILDIFPPSFTADTANFVTINNGTLRFSTSATLTPFAGNAQIPANGGLWLNNASANITVTDSLGVAGLLRVTSGSLTVGSTANGNLRSGGGTFLFEGGTTTVAGRFDARDITTITNFQMTAGTLTVNTNGSVYAYAAPFSMTVAGSTFTMSGGTIIIQRQGGNSLGYVNTGASSSYAVNGGTIQIGNGSTPGTDILGIQSNIPIYNLTVTGAAGVTGLAGSDLTVLNNVTIGNGTFLNGSTRTVTVRGNWIDNGTYTAGTSTVVFNGSSQSISRASGESFNNVTVNSTGTVSLSNNVSVAGAVALNQGTLAVGSNTLTLNGAVSSTSGSLTSASTGTVNYNQGSVGQSVLAANYGNLTFSNFNKVLASSGTIGIAGVFTPGSAVGHTNTGSTIDYNSGGAQAVVPFTYRNLVVSNGGVKTASGASTVQGNLTISSGLTLADGGFSIAVNGNVSNSSLHSSTGAGSLTLTGGGAAHTLSGGGSFGNLTMNDANGATLSGSVTVNGTLTFTSGVITAANDTVMLSSSGTVVRTSGHVNGWLRKYVPTGSPSVVYEIGTASNFLPDTVAFASVTNAGTLSVRNIAGDHPQISLSAITPTNSVNRYWTFVNNGLAFTTANVTLSWINPGDQDVPAAFGTYLTGRYINSAWDTTASNNRSASNIRATGVNAFGDFAVGAGAATNAYRTKASGDWANYTTVWEVYDGSAWGPATKSPQLTDGTITIQNGHSVTVSTNLSGATDGIDQLTIQPTGRIDVNTGGTLEIRNSTAPGMTVYGILQVSGGALTTNGGPTITFANGSKYIHNQDGGTIPTATFGATSTVEITGVTTTVPAGLAQTFGNFVWNSSGQTANINLAGNPTTVSSDFVVASTGTAELLLNDNTAAGKTIGGRFDVRGGRVVVKTAGNTAYAITVADSLSLTGGRLTLLRGNGTGAVTVTVSGHILVATSASDTLDLSSSSANVSGTINVAKNFTHTGGVISESGAGTAAGNIVFNGTTPQTYSSTGNFWNRVNFTLNSGTTVNMGTSVAAGAGTFTVSAGANLGIGSLQGISAAGATGNVQTTTRSFNVAANYIYNGAGAQITGTGLPATANKLIITNASGVQLSSNVAVTDSLQLLSGLFGIQTNTLTLNNVIYRTSGSLTSATTGTFNYNKASAGQVVIGAQYGNLTFSNFNKTFPSSPADVVKIAGTFTAGSASGHTLTGSSVDFNGASQTIPVLPYNNLRVSGSGTAILAGNTFVSGTLDISGVTLSDGSFNLTANGNVNNTGTHTGTGRIVLSGSGSTRMLTGGGSYANLEINDVNGANFSGNIVINGTLILTNGLLTSATDTVIVNTPSAGVSKSGNFSHVNAKMKKLVPVNASPQSFTFEIGDGTTYAPVNLTVLSVSTAGSITVSTAGGDHPQIATSGINASKSVNRYWTIGKIGLVLSSYNAVFNYPSSDIDAGANSSVFVVKKYSAGWSRTTTGSRTSTSTQSLGLTTFEDFAVGEVSPIVYWNRGAGTSSWKNPLNWSTQEVPLLTSTAVLNIADSVAVDTAVSVKTIMIQNSGMRLAAQPGFLLKVTDTLYLQQGTLHIQTTRFDSVGRMQITGGTVAYDLSSGNQIIKAFSYKNLTVSGGGTKSAEGAFTVADTLRIVSSATFKDSTFTITANKDIINTGTHTGAGKILLTGGSANHNISGGGPFTNLELNDAFGATIATSVNVNGVLTLTSGVLATGANTLTIGSGGSLTRTGGWVNGTLGKDVSGASPSPTLEIGDATNYTPVSVAFTGVTASGTLTAKTTTPDHPQIATSGIDAAHSANRYWTLTNVGGTIAFTSYSATFNFINPGDLDAGTDPNQFMAGLYSGAAWSQQTVGTRTASSTQVTGATLFGDFQLGQPGFYTSIVTGNWNAPGTWDRNAVPTSNSAVVIASGTTVTINVNTADLKTVTIQNTGTLAGGGAFTLTLGANGGTDFDNSGTFTANSVGVKLNKNSQWVGSGVFNLNTIDFNSKSLTLAFASSNTIHLAGSGDPLLNPGTLVPGTTSTIDYNGSAAQLMSPAAGINFNSVQVSNAAGVTLQKDLNATDLAGNLTVASGGILNTSDGTNVYSITGAGGSTVLTIGAASKIKIGSNAASAGSFASGFGSYSLDPTSTVEYANSSSATQNVSATTIYGNILFTGTASKSLGAGSIALAGSWTNNSTGGSIVAGTSTVTFSGSSSSVNGSVASQTFNNVVINKTAGQTLSIGGSTTSVTVNGSLTLTSGILDAGTATAMSVGGNWTNNGGSFNGGTGTVTFNGSGAQSVGGSSATTFNNLTISGTTVTLTNDAPISGNLLITTGTMDLATFAANRTASGGSMTINSGTTLKVSGSSGGVAGSNFPNNFTTMNLNGTAEFSGSGAQTIPAFSYANLTSSSTGGRTLASSGTIGISGIFTPGSNTYTITGSTVDFNGAGSQSIAALNYDNLTISGNRSGNTVTLPAGTVRVAAVFAPTATAVSYVNTGNTFEYNGSSPQTVTPFTYFNLTLSGTGAKTVAASQTANGDVHLVTGTSLTVDPAVVWQIDGSLTLDGSSVNNGTINVGN